MTNNYFLGGRLSHLAFGFDGVIIILNNQWKYLRFIYLKMNCFDVSKAEVR
jgi:hypothetical protein